MSGELDIQNVIIIIVLLWLIMNTICPDKLQNLTSPMVSYFGNKTTLYFFSMEGCGYCAQFMPEWEKIKSYSNSANFNAVKVDINKNPTLAGKYEVSSVPHIVKVVGKTNTVYNGNRTAQSIIDWVNQ